MADLTLNIYYEFKNRFLQDGTENELFTGYQQEDGSVLHTKIKKSIKFSFPYKEYDVGPEILVIKNALVRFLDSGQINMDEYIERSGCDQFPSPSDGPLFDKKTKAALTLYQEANKQSMISYYSKIYGGLASSREENMLREIGTFDLATFACMHAFSDPNSEYYDKAFTVPTQIPATRDRDGRFTADPLLIDPSVFYLAAEQVLLPTVTASDAKSARLVAQFGQALYDATEEAREVEKERRSIEYFVRPDPEAAQDPYVVSNSIIGFMMDTRFTLQDPPVFPFEDPDTGEEITSQAYENALTRAAIELVFDHYKKSKNYLVTIRTSPATDDRGRVLPPVPPTYTLSDAHSPIANVESDISQMYPQVQERVMDVINSAGLGAALEDQANVNAILFSMGEVQQIKGEITARQTTQLRNTALRDIFFNNTLGPIDPLDKFIDDHGIPLIEFVGYETPTFRPGMPYKAEFRISRQKLSLAPSKYRPESKSVQRVAEDYDLEEDQEVSAKSISESVVSSDSVGNSNESCGLEEDQVEESVWDTEEAIQAALSRNKERLEELKERAREQRLKAEADYRRAIEIYQKDEERVQRRQDFLEGKDNGSAAAILGPMLGNLGIGEALSQAGLPHTWFEKDPQGGNPLRANLDDFKSDIKTVSKALKDLIEDYEEWKSAGYDEETGTGGEITTQSGLEPVDLEEASKKLTDMLAVIEGLIDVRGDLQLDELRLLDELVDTPQTYTKSDNPAIEIKFTKERSKPIVGIDGATAPGQDLGFRIESIRAACVDGEPKVEVWPYIRDENPFAKNGQPIPSGVSDAIDLLDFPSYAAGYMLQYAAIISFLKTPIKALQGSCLDFLKAAPSIALITRFTIPTQVIGQPDDEEGWARLAGPLKEEAEKLQEQWDTYVVSIEKGIKSWTKYGKSYSVADILPAFGPGCGKTWEEAMDTIYKEFLDKFNIGVLICEILKCLGLWPIGLNLDLKLRLPKFPRLPTFDLLGPIKEITLNVLKQMLIRLFCQICRKIIELLKLEACTPESAALPNMPNDFLGNDLSDYLPPAIGALTNTGIPVDRLDDVSDVIDDMALIMSPAELCGLMQGNPTEKSLMVVKNLIASAAPDLAEYLNTTEKVKILFAKIGFMMGTSICDAIEEADNRSAKVDCRCPEVIQLSNNLQENLVTDEQRASALEIARKNVEDVLNAFQKLASGDIATDMIENVVNFGNPDAGLGAMTDGMKQILHTGTKALIEPVKSEFYSDVGIYIPSFYSQTTVVERGHSTEPGVDIIAERERIVNMERLRLYDFHLAMMSSQHTYGTPYFTSDYYASLNGGGLGFIKPVGSRDLNVILNATRAWHIVYRMLWNLREVLYAPFQDEWYDADSGIIVAINYDPQSPIELQGMPMLMTSYDYTNPYQRRIIAETQKSSPNRWRDQSSRILNLAASGDGSLWSHIVANGNWTKRLRMTRSPVYAPWGDVPLTLLQPNGYVDANGKFSEGFQQANGIVGTTFGAEPFADADVGSLMSFGANLRLGLTRDYNHLNKALYGIDLSAYEQNTEGHWSHMCAPKPVMMFKEMPSLALVERGAPNPSNIRTPFGNFFGGEAARRLLQARHEITWAPSVSITNLAGGGQLIESEFKVTGLGKGGRHYKYPGIPGWKKERPNWHIMKKEIITSISHRIQELIKNTGDSVRQTSNSSQSGLGRRRTVFLPTLREFFSKEAEVMQNKLDYVSDDENTNKNFQMIIPPRLLGLDDNRFKQFTGVMQYEEFPSTGMFDSYKIRISDPYFLNDLTPSDKTVIINRCDEFPMVLNEDGEEMDFSYLDGADEPYDTRMEVFKTFVGRKFRRILDAYQSDMTTNEDSPFYDQELPVTVSAAFDSLRQHFLSDNFNWVDLYKSGFETIVEDVFDQIADSSFFTEEYIQDLGDRIKGRPHMNSDGCLENSDSLPNKGLVDFEKLVRESMDKVMTEYTQPTAFKNIDYSKPGPFEKAVRKISAELLVRIFLIEYSLRGGIAFSTFNAGRIFNKDAIVKELVETWIKEYEFSERRNPILHRIKDDFEHSIKELAGLEDYSAALSKVVSNQLDPNVKGNFLNFIDKIFKPKIIDSPQYAFLNRIPRTDPWKIESLGYLNANLEGLQPREIRELLEEQDDEINPFVVGSKNLIVPNPSVDDYGRTYLKKYNLDRDGTFFLEFYVRLGGEANKRMSNLMRDYSEILEKRYEILYRENFEGTSYGVDTESVYHIDEFTQFASGQLQDILGAGGFTGLGYYPPDTDELSLKPVCAERYPARFIKLERFHSTISWKDCSTYWLKGYNTIEDVRNQGANIIRPDVWSHIGTPWEDMPFQLEPGEANAVQPRQRQKGWDQTRYFVAPADIRESYKSLTRDGVLQNVLEDYGRSHDIRDHVHTAMRDVNIASSVSAHKFSTRSGGVYGLTAVVGDTSDQQASSWFRTGGGVIVSNSKFIGDRFGSSPQAFESEFQQRSERLFKVQTHHAESEDVPERVTLDANNTDIYKIDLDNRTTVQRTVEMAGVNISNLGILGSIGDDAIDASTFYAYPLYAEHPRDPNRNLWNIDLSNREYVDPATGELSAGGYFGYGEVNKVAWDWMVGSDVFETVRPQQNSRELETAEAQFDEVYEHWTQYVIDVVGLAAPVFSNPGESYHHPGDLPSLKWQELENISRAESEHNMYSSTEAEATLRRGLLGQRDGRYGLSQALFVNSLEKAPQWTLLTGRDQRDYSTEWAGSLNYTTWLLGPAAGLPFDRVIPPGSIQAAANAGNFNADEGVPRWVPNALADSEPFTFANLADRGQMFNKVASLVNRRVNGSPLGLQVMGSSENAWDHRNNRSSRLVHHQPYLYTWVPSFKRGTTNNVHDITPEDNFRARLSRPLGLAAGNYGAAFHVHDGVRMETSHEGEWYELEGYDIDEVNFANPTLAAPAVSWLTSNGDVFATTSNTTKCLSVGRQYQVNLGQVYNSSLREIGAVGEAYMERAREANEDAVVLHTIFNQSQNQNRAQHFDSVSRIDMYDYDSEARQQWIDDNKGEFLKSMFFQNGLHSVWEHPGTYVGEREDFPVPSGMAFRHNEDSYRSPIRLLVTRVDYMVNGESVDFETYIDFDISKTMSGADYELFDANGAKKEIIGYNEEWTEAARSVDEDGDDIDPDSDAARLDEVEGVVGLDEEFDNMDDARQSSINNNPHDPEINSLTRTPIYGPTEEEFQFKYPRSKSNTVRRNALRQAAINSHRKFVTYQRNTNISRNIKYDLGSMFDETAESFNRGMLGSDFVGHYARQVDKFISRAVYDGNTSYPNPNQEAETTSFRIPSHSEAHFNIPAFNVNFNPSRAQLTRLSFASRADTILSEAYGKRFMDEPAPFEGISDIGSENMNQVTYRRTVMNLPFTTVASMYSEAANVEVKWDYERSGPGDRPGMSSKVKVPFIDDATNTNRVLGSNAVPTTATKIQSRNYQPGWGDKAPRRFSRDQIEIDHQFSLRPGFLVKSSFRNVRDSELSFVCTMNRRLNSETREKPWHEAMDVPSYFPTVNNQRWIGPDVRASSYARDAFPQKKELDDEDSARMRTFIDFFISTWVSERRLESFWGRTSSKAWLKGQIPASNYSGPAPSSRLGEDLTTVLGNMMDHDNCIIVDCEKSRYKLEKGTLTYDAQNYREPLIVENNVTNLGMHMYGLYPPQTPVEASAFPGGPGPMGAAPSWEADKPVLPPEGDRRKWSPAMPESVAFTVGTAEKPFRWVHRGRFYNGMLPRRQGNPGSTLYSPIVGDGRYLPDSTSTSDRGGLLMPSRNDDRRLVNSEYELEDEIAEKLNNSAPLGSPSYNFTLYRAQSSQPRGTNIARYAAASSIKTNIRFSRERGPLSNSVISDLANSQDGNGDLDFTDLINNSEVKFGIRLVQVAPRSLSAQSVPFEFMNNGVRGIESENARVEEIFEDICIGERTYYMNLSVGDADPSGMMCIPLLSTESAVPASCLVNPNSVASLFQEYRGILVDGLVTSPQFELVSNYIYPTERVLAMASIYGTMALSTKEKLSGLLDPTKNALANLISLSGDKKTEYGNAWSQGTAFDQDNSNVDLHNRLKDMITSDGPKLGCGEMPNFDWKKFLKKLLEYIIYLVPSIIRAIAMMIDPAYKDMHRLFHQCTPNKEHVNSLTWKGVFPFTEAGWGFGIRGVEGREVYNGVVRGNKYAPITTAFPIDLFNGLTFIAAPPFVIPNPSFFKSLGKFAAFVMGAMPFGIGGGAGISLPPCAGDNDIGGSDEAQEELFDPTRKYGHLLTPFGALALSMPELPGERARDINKLCAVPQSQPAVPTVDIDFSRTIRDNTDCRDGAPNDKDVATGQAPAGDNQAANPGSLFEE